MDFDTSRAIYLQIAGYVIERILLKDWPDGGKVASVRELATRLAVNPNTVMRGYDWLQYSGILENHARAGYFVTSDGRKQALALQKEELMEKQLPYLFRTMYLLEMQVDELNDPYKEYRQASNL